MDTRIANNYFDLAGVQQLKRGGNEAEALRAVAREFEAMFVNTLFKGMRATNEMLQQDSSLSGGDVGFYQSMFDQQLATQLAANGGIGLADTLFRQMAARFEQNAPAAGVEDMAAPALRRTSSTPTASATAAGEPAQDGDADSFVARCLPAARRVAKALGLDPLVLVAQAALETGWGRHTLKGPNGDSHNLFNIKAHGDWQGERVEKQVREFRGGRPVTERAEFRAYGSIAESFADFQRFLTTNQRYAEALEAAPDAAAFVNGLARAGYATDPAYADKVLAVYHQLHAQFGKQSP